MPTNVTAISLRAILAYWCGLRVNNGMILKWISNSIRTWTVFGNFHFHIHAQYLLFAVATSFGLKVWPIIVATVNNIQGVPLATEPSISLIILPLMRIFQRNLKRTYLIV